MGGVTTARVAPCQFRTMHAPADPGGGQRKEVDNNEDAILAPRHRSDGGGRAFDRRIGRLADMTNEQ
jgi:hypothetical protein